MIRYFALSFICVLCSAGLVSAGKLKIDYVGKIKSVDRDKKTLTLTVTSAKRQDRVPVQVKEVTFKVVEATEFIDAQGGKLAEGLKAKDLAEGAEVAIAGEKHDKKTVIAIKVTLAAGKKDKPAEK